MKYINFLNNTKFYFIFLVLGLCIFFSKALISDFDLLFGGYDNLYYNYVLEHSFLWIKGIHNSFWSAPFNYYDINSLAQADSLFAIAPIYWFIRLLKNPFAAYQILFMLLCIINYSCFYYFLKCLKLNRFASSIGAFIFAFSILRYFNFDNISSFTQFLSIISLIFILKVSVKNKRIINHLYFLLSSVFLILQLYTCFALGFFTVFCGFFAILLSLLPKNSRVVVIEYFKNFYKLILFYIFVIFLSLLPLMYHFVCMEYYTPLSKILNNISSYAVWFRSLSILDNKLFNFNYDYIDYNSHLSSMSCGIFTTLTAIIAFLKTPKAKGVSLLTFGFIFLVFSGYSAILFWKIFYSISFGIESLDSIVSGSFIALIIISVGIALFFNNIKNKIVIILFLTLILSEQICYNSDPNSSLKNCFISKKDFISSIENIKSVDNYINIKFIAKNTEEYGNMDILFKNEKARKIVDSKALWLGIKENKPVINNYPNKSKPQKQYKCKPINLIVDYNQI